MKKIIVVIIATLLAISLSACNPKYSKNSYFEVEKLKKTKYEKVIGSQYKDLEIKDEFKNALIDFSYYTASQLLEDRNGMYSPISFYIALSELAEVTAGNTQKEIIDVLRVENLDILRDGNQALYKKLSYENKISTLRIANSIWLNKHKEYNDNALENLRNYYYASSYGIDFSIEKEKKLIGDWVSDNTGGNLGKGDFLNLESDVVFVLLNTIYFYDEWSSKFEKSLNSFDSFEGLSSDVEYMNQKIKGYYFKTDDYELSYLNFKNGLRISFLKPLESNELEEFINDADKLKLLSDSKEENAEIQYKIPKFNYKSTFRLEEFAFKMGLREIFGIGDFSPLTNKDTSVTDIYQKTFIEIDEKGGKAGAYTSIIAKDSAIDGEPVTFALNKPFIYAIYADDIPLFIGVVTNPSSNAEEIYS